MASWYSPSGLGPPMSRASLYIGKNHGDSTSTSSDSSEHSAVIRPTTRRPSRSSSSVLASSTTIAVMSSSIWRTKPHASRAAGGRSVMAGTLGRPPIVVLAAGRRVTSPLWASSSAIRDSRVGTCALPLVAVVAILGGIALATADGSGPTRGRASATSTTTTSSTTTSSTRPTTTTTTAPPLPPPRRLRRRRPPPCARAAATERVATTPDGPPPGCHPSYSGCVPITAGTHCTGQPGAGPTYAGAVPDRSRRVRLRPERRRHGLRSRRLDLNPRRESGGDQRVQQVSTDSRVDVSGQRAAWPGIGPSPSPGRRPGPGTRSRSSALLEADDGPGLGLAGAPQGPRPGGCRPEGCSSSFAVGDDHRRRLPSPGVDLLLQVVDVLTPLVLVHLDQHRMPRRSGQAVELVQR